MILGWVVCDKFGTEWTSVYVSYSQAQAEAARRETLNQGAGFHVAEKREGDHVSQKRS